MNSMPTSLYSESASPLNSPSEIPSPVTMPNHMFGKKTKKKTGMILFLLLSLGISALVLYQSIFKNEQTNVVSQATGNVAVPVLINGSSPRPISSYIWGMNWGVGQDTTGGLTSYMNQWDRPQLKALGIKAIRYHGGCNGDAYNVNPVTENGRLVTKLSYQDPTGQKVKYSVPVAEAITFAQDIGASLIYQLNVETKGLPTPCGSTPTYPLGNEAQRLSILRADLQYILNNYPSIRVFELGNEPWGAWNAQEYVATAQIFANDIKQFNPAVNPPMKVGIVGYPTSGNNMDPQSTNQNDIAWTQAVQSVLGTKCGGVPCFDYVTDHPYYYQGYSDPALWTINPSVPNPDGGIGTIPSKQYTTVSFIASGGTTAYSYSCPINHKRGGILGYECTPMSAGVDLRGLRGGQGESYSTQTAFAFFQDQDGVKKQKLAQVLLNPEGNTGWSRVCPVSDSGVLWSECLGWTQFGLSTFLPLSPLLPNGGVNQSFSAWGGEAYFVATGSNPPAYQQWVRQRVVPTGTGDIWERRCPFPNGQLQQNECTQWQMSTPIVGVTIASIDSSMYFGISNDGFGTQIQFINDTILAADGHTYYYRTCEVQSNGTIQCPSYKSTSLSSIRGVGNETYIGIAGYTIFSNTATPNVFPLNIPGTGAYVAAREFGERIQSRLTSYAPKQLALTEWNMKCWGGGDMGKRNFSVDTVDQGFFVAESFLQMADKGIFSSGFHDLNQGLNLVYGCGLFISHAPGTVILNSAGQAFSATSVLAGGTLYASVPNGFFSSGVQLVALPLNARCQGSGCLRGGYDISSISSYAGLSQDQNHLYVFLLNRDTVNSVDATLQFTSVPNIAQFTQYKTKSYSASAFTQRTFTVTDSNTLPYQSSTVISVPPVSIVRVELIKAGSPTPSSVPPTAPPAAPTSQPTSPIQQWKAFVTSTTYAGNLGGITGADAICQSRAVTAGLTGTYKAWVSDATVAAIAHNQPSQSRPYYGVNGTLIANDLNDIITPSTAGDYLQNPLRFDEFGNSVTAPLYAWSNTLENGLARTTQANGSCSGWYSNSSSLTGYIGRPSQKGSAWTKGTSKSCATPQRLYCFQKN